MCACPLPQPLQHLIIRQRLAIRSGRCHRSKRIGNGEYPRTQRNGLAVKPLGVSAAIPFLVVVHDASNTRGKLVDIADDMRTEAGMRLDRLPFGCIKLNLLVEDTVRYADLTDVMQQR